LKIQKFFQLGSSSVNDCDKIIINTSGIETYNNNKMNTVASVKMSDYIHIEGNFNVYDKDELIHNDIKYMTIKDNIITLIKECNDILEIEKIYNLNMIKFKLKDVK